MRVLFACVFVWCGQATTDIQIAASTFETFTTAFSLTGSNLKMPLAVVDSVAMSGTLQFDLASKKLKMTSVSSYGMTYNKERNINGKVGRTLNGTFSSVVLVDVANSKVHFNVAKETASVSGQALPGYSGCRTLTIPRQRSQKLSMYLTTARLTSAVAMANAMLNMMPHTTADGMATFTNPHGTIAIKTTGVPVAVNLTDGTGRAGLIFSRWGSSSGDMSAPTCTPSELDEEFAGGLFGVRDMVGLLEVHPVIAEAISDASEAVLDVSEILYGPRQDDDSGFWTLVTVFCISGISGAALVLAFAKISARRNCQSSPLLAEV